LVIMKLAIIAALVMSSTVASAESSAEPPATESTHIDVEWIASLAPLGGVGAKAGTSPGSVPQLRVGLGAFALELPQFGLDDNADMGWTVTDLAGMAEARYSLSPGRGGAFVALDLLYQRRTFELAGTAGSSHVGQYIAAAAIGYEYFPFARHGLFVTANFTLAVRFAETGTPGHAGMAFSEKRVLPLPGVNLGWQL
jgi:hypothetical protein